MAQDDPSNAGIFGKMMRFVRNPTTDWASIDQKESDREESYSKQALKEMIERKRRNDFVRKREFDMLRKLRRREASGVAGSQDASVRPSFFQSSMPSRPDDRAMTLKKIDEIEAQMSMQWWKTKHGVTNPAPVSSSGANSSSFGTSSLPTPTGLRASTPHPQGAIDSQRSYARTTPDNLNDAIKRSMERLQQQQAQREASSVDMHRPVSAPPMADAGLPEPSSESPIAYQATEPVSLSETPLAKPASMAAPGLNAPTAEARVPAAAPVALAGARAAMPAKTEGFNPGAASPGAAGRAEPAKPASPMLGHMAGSMEHQATSGFTASKLFALDVDEVQHDPELEEAAIRFANGDDDGAEAGLKEAIAPSGSRHHHEETWFTLFDLYRATGNQVGFDALGIDFAGKFGRSAPLWFSIPDMVGKMAGAQAKPAAAAALNAAGGARKSDWRAPANFGIQTLAALKAAAARTPMPWTLDWGNLQLIEDNAVVPLAQLFTSWAAQSVQLRYMGTAVLDEVLARDTPSGSRDVHQDRWNLRLAHLRVTHRPDEFELAALDFCVTYELSPPAWENARCEFKFIDADGNTGMGQTIISEAVRDSITSEFTPDSMNASLTTSHMTAQLAAVELSGQIQGDPQAMLEKLEVRLQDADVMVISCAKLIRVDFSAAGTVLNWVSAKHAEGRLVHFTEVNRLVAAFFHVIGISEQAKVQTRVN
jgi:ABC-type transporter Mla MlaB component